MIIGAVALASIAAPALDAAEVFRGSARSLPYRGGDLGIEFEAYDPQPGESDHLVFEVTSISSGSPLFRRLGLGDVIVALDGYYFSSASDFSAYIGSKREGEPIRVQHGPAESDDISEVSVRIPTFGDLLLGAIIDGAARGGQPPQRGENPNATDPGSRQRWQMEQPEIRNRFK